MASKSCGDPHNHDAHTWTDANGKTHQCNGKGTGLPAPW